MGDASAAAPNPDASKAEARKDFYPLKLFGMEIPLPHWALSALAVAHAARRLNNQTTK
jgi:hypothetical protein